MDNTPFFMVGSGRSGTTLLRLIVASHSRITIPPETRFLLEIVDELPLSGPLDARAISRAIELMTTNYRWPDMELSEPLLRERIDRLIDPTLGDLLGVVYGVWLERDGKVRWGDKTPAYIRIVPQLCQLFPGAKFIHLVRDGRDVTKSFQRTGWFGPRLSANSAEWRESIATAATIKATLGEHRLLEIRYEDLVSSTTSTVRRLCAFLGEEFEPAMLNWETSVERKVPAREARFHRKLHRRPRIDDTDRWKREMSRLELLVTESYIGEGLRATGYEPYFRSRAWRPLQVVIRAVSPIAWLARRGLRAIRQRLSALSG